MLIGSIGDDNPQEDSGSAYVYKNTQVTSTLPGQLLISEFRLYGPNGDNDEFIELYNNTDSVIVVDPTDGSSGFALAASDGQTRFIVPTGTVIPARGHFLATNTPGYSLGSYAAGDAFLNPGIPVNAGIALFNTSNPISFNQANRLDAAGSSSETNALFREGGGYAPFNVFVDMQFSLLRDLSSGRPADTQDNQADFRVVGATVFVRADARYGYPGPENLASPVERNAQFVVGLLDPSQSASVAPNRVRDFSTSTPCSSFGTLSIRRTLTNNTGTTVTRLRFRVTSITTAPAPSGTADLRPISSVNTTVVVAGTPHTVLGTTLETAGEALLNNCGGLNSSLAVPAVTPLFTSKEPKGDSLRRGSPAKGGVAPAAGATWNEITLEAALDAGASLDVQFLLGVQQTGVFRFFVTIEALP